MPYPAPARSCALLVVLAACVFCSDITRWGTVKGDLQLGIGTTSTSGLALRISLKNVGTLASRIPIGFEGTAGPIYNVKLAAFAPQKSARIEVFDLRALKAVSGPPSQISAHLESGEAYQIEFPLSQLICVVNHQDVPLQELLPQGYSLRASFEASGIEVTAPDFYLSQ